MDDIQTYAQITTVAVCLLILFQIIFLTVLAVILFKIKKILTNLKQTSDMSKDFVRSLREEQLRRVPLWRLGLFAFKRVQSLRHK